MPVYEYRCRSCDRLIEEVQPMGSPPPGPCPRCGGDLRRSWSRVAVVYRGWGFNRNDRLIGDRRRPRRDFRALKEKAEEISES